MKGFVIFNNNYALNRFMGWDALWKAKVWTKDEVMQIIGESANWEVRPTHIRRGSDDGQHIEVFGETKEL